jgi:serine/threonine protein phosphatase PrpC
VKCQGPVAADGYCSLCGHKALEPVAVDDRGALAYATHKGRRHERNEDSAALAATSEGWPVLVVSDGVSVSPNPHLASAAAVLAATSRLGGRPFSGPADLVAAVEGAQVAVCEVPSEGDPHWLVADGTHPSCTIVIAVATGTELHVANVGDARAHLLTQVPGDSAGPGSGSGWKATQLTIDDSAAAQAIAEGIDAEIALSLPGGHAITAWLGADARGVTPHLAVHPLAAGDVVLATSDGLWNYAATDAALSDLVSTLLPPADELLAGPGLGGHCERLVTWAVDQGGADNVTVAITPAPVPDQRHIEQEEPA